MTAGCGAVRPGRRARGAAPRRLIPALGSLRGLGKPLNLSASVSPSAKVGGIQFYLTGLL